MPQWPKKIRCSPHIHKEAQNVIKVNHLRPWRKHLGSPLGSHFWIHEVEEGDWEYQAVIEADEPRLTNLMTALFD